MILGFGTKETERIWKGERVKNLPLEVQEAGRRKLRMINNAQNWSDLRIPPSNKLGKLIGTEFFNIRINDQWRIIFKWLGNNADAVKITDYH